MTVRIPKYRHHKATGQAFVEIRGTRIYLGKHGSPESRETYRRTIAELMTPGGAERVHLPGHLLEMLFDPHDDGFGAVQLAELADSFELVGRCRDRTGRHGRGHRLELLTGLANALDVAVASCLANRTQLPRRLLKHQVNQLKQEFGVTIGSTQGVLDVDDRRVLISTYLLGLGADQVRRVSPDHGRQRHRAAPP